MSTAISPLGHCGMRMESVEIVRIDNKLVGDEVGVMSPAVLSIFATLDIRRWKSNIFCG